MIEAVHRNMVVRIRAEHPEYAEAAQGFYDFAVSTFDPAPLEHLFAALQGSLLKGDIAEVMGWNGANFCGRLVGR